MHQIIINPKNKQVSSVLTPSRGKVALGDKTIESCMFLVLTKSIPHKLPYVRLRPIARDLLLGSQKSDYPWSKHHMMPPP